MHIWANSIPQLLKNYLPIHLYKAIKLVFLFMNLPSKRLEQAVQAFSRLPGIGQKTALRMVLYLLKQNNDEVNEFAKAFHKLKEEIQYCKVCHNISDADVCSICSNHRRNQEELCIVEDIRDIIAIENTQQYQGLYHVLGGLISPMDGKGPSDLNIDSLIERVNNSDVKEVIMALSATMEGDTTIFYLHKKLKESNVKITTISRGVAFGGELEYVDELTLGRSILSRINYQQLNG
jgi:recombination protein RecR